MNYQSSETFRPISAANQRPAFILQKSEKNISKGQQDFPKLNPPPLINYQEALSSRNLSINGISKERLYEELLQYKNDLNTLRKELALAKSANNKKSQEIGKKDKILEEIVNEVDLNPFQTGKGQKAKDAYLISSLKTQFLDIKNQLQLKNEEYEELKKHIKNTKFKELTLEISILNEEISKLKSFYSISLQQNQANEYLEKELFETKEELKLHKTLSQNQLEIIMKLENDLRNLIDENSKIKEELYNKSQWLKKNEFQLKNQKKINLNLTSNKEESFAIKQIKANYDKKINDLNKEVNLFMSKAE